MRLGPNTRALPRRALCERSVAMLPAARTRGACASVASRVYCQIGGAIDFCTPVTRLSDSCAPPRENEQVTRQTSE